MPLRVFFFVAVLCSGYAGAQDFGQLATNRDGSVLYFSSPLRIKGTSQYLYPKIFTWDSSNGLKLYEQRETDVPFPTPPEFVGTEFFWLVAPDVSSDGAVVSITGTRYCNTGSNCLAQEEYQSTISTNAQPTIQTPGSASLSRNGRFALLRSSVNQPFANSTVYVLDLLTGQKTPYMAAWQAPGGEHQVADNGSVALATTTGFAVGTGGQLTSIVAPAVTANASPLNPLITAAGNLVIYQSGGGQNAPAQLSVYSVTNGSKIKTLVSQPAATVDFRPSISDDGNVVAFVSGSSRQAYVINSSGTGLRQITSFSEPVTEIKLSGDGTIAFAVTAANRIARINVATAQSIDVVPPTPYLTHPLADYDAAIALDYRFMVSRGVVTTVSGVGFAAGFSTASAPFPLSLGGVELKVDGVAVPIAAASPTSVGYPATWDLPDTPVDVEIWVTSATASPFVPGFEVGVEDQGFFLSKFPSLIAVHQDFLSLVSASSPALPGEHIHLYATDLGPVVPAPPAGLPTPLEPASMLATPVSCTLGVGGNTTPVPVNVSFVGLAPLLLNVFQVDLEMPPSFQGSPSRLNCLVGYPSVGVTISGELAVQ